MHTWRAMRCITAFNVAMHRLIFAMKIHWKRSKKKSCVLKMPNTHICNYHLFQLLRLLPFLIFIYHSSQRFIHVASAIVINSKCNCDKCNQKNTTRNACAHAAHEIAPQTQKPSTSFSLLQLLHHTTYMQTFLWTLLCQRCACLFVRVCCKIIPQNQLSF